VLVTGAGPIGLLAACGARLHGMEVHVLDRVEAGLKPELVRALGATYHSGSVKDVDFEPDVIVEKALARTPDDIKVVIQF
jgi:threonine dehydrogenase-like Zn-dependent dehydrogenase